MSGSRLRRLPNERAQLGLRAANPWDVQISAGACVYARRLVGLRQPEMQYSGCFSLATKTLDSGKKRRDSKARSRYSRLPQGQSSALTRRHTDACCLQERRSLTHVHHSVPTGRQDPDRGAAVPDGHGRGVNGSNPHCGSHSTLRTWLWGKPERPACRSEVDERWSRSRRGGHPMALNRSGITSTEPDACVMPLFVLAGHARSRSQLPAVASAKRRLLAARGLAMADLVRLNRGRAH